MMTLKVQCTHVTLMHAHTHIHKISYIRDSNIQITNIYGRHNYLQIRHLA